MLLKASFAVRPEQHTQETEVEMSNQSGRGGQSSVSCRGCGTLLNYATPAQSVRCILCSTVTPTAVALVGVSHLVCGSCRTILEYPSGATSVRCSVCDAVSLTARRELTATVRCRGCSTELNYPSGAASVRCALCHHVTTVRGGTLRIQAPGPLHEGLQHQTQRQNGGGGSPSQDNEVPECGKQSSTLYVIQHPCKEGEERYNMAIGLKIVA